MDTARNGMQRSRNGSARDELTAAIAAIKWPNPRWAAWKADRAYAHETAARERMNQAYERVRAARCPGARTRRYCYTPRMKIPAALCTSGRRGARRARARGPVDAHLRNHLDAADVGAGRFTLSRQRQDGRLRRRTRAAVPCLRTGRNGRRHGRLGRQLHLGPARAAGMQRRGVGAALLRWPRPACARPACAKRAWKRMTSM